jgi:hypothetical protein
MAVLALAAAGSMVGSTLITGTFLGMTGASIGWMAGSMLGNALMSRRQKFEGPRINDLSVQASAYGTAIPRVWGTYRVAGNVVWCTDKRERSKTERVGGKGGGGAKSTTYTYDVDMAVALCWGPAEIRKIWNNGKLIADFSEGGSAATWNASAVGAQGFRVYAGTADQLPDSLYEAEVGVGMAPAFRGICYVVFERLACPGGQIPQLSFEVVVGGDQGPEQIYTAGEATVAEYGQMYGAAFGGARDFVGIFGHSGEVEAQVVATMESITSERVLNLGTSTNEQAGWSILSEGSSDTPGLLYRYRFSNTLEWWAPGNYEKYSWDNLPFTSDSNVSWRKRGDDIAVFDRGTGLILFILSGGSNWVNAPGAARWCWFTATKIYVGGDEYAGGANLWMTTYDRDSLQVLSTETWASGAAGKPHSMFGVATFEESDSKLWIIAGGSTVGCRICYYDGTTWTQEGPLIEGIFRPRVLHVDGRVVNVGHQASSTQYGVTTINLQTVTASTAQLGTIIADICGLTPSDPPVDVTGLTEEVAGYAISSVVPARSALEPLLKAHFVDARESDGAIEFFKRADREVVAEIPFDELGAAEAGSEPGEPFALQRTNAEELPRSVTVNYIAQTAEYEPGTEAARRMIVPRGADIVEELPIVFANADKPASIAHGLLYDAWAGQNVRKLRLTRRYAHLDAGDHVEVEYPRNTWTRVRLASIADDGMVLEADCVPVEPAIYTAVVEGSPIEHEQGVDPLPGDTRMVVLDIPLLRDQDDSADPYVAMNGWGTGWRGAALYAGIWPSPPLQGTVTTGAVIGNKLTVRVPVGQLTSITRERMLSTTENTFALGVNSRWEICQFRDAVDNGDGTFTLSGLRRGLKGTEYAFSQGGYHLIGDTFVLLTGDGMLRPGLDNDQIDDARAYRAISAGSDIVTHQSFTNHGYAALPTAPTDLRVAKQANGDIVFTWNRRSRYADNWLLGYVPLAEDVEEWNVVVNSRIIITNTASATYTAAQQASDPGGVFTSGLVIVRQISSSGRVGRDLYQNVST